MNSECGSLFSYINTISFNDCSSLPKSIESTRCNHSPAFGKRRYTKQVKCELCILDDNRLDVNSASTATPSSAEMVTVNSEFIACGLPSLVYQRGKLGEMVVGSVSITPPSSAEEAAENSLLTVCRVPRLHQPKKRHWIRCKQCVNCPTLVSERGGM